MSHQRYPESGYYLSFFLSIKALNSSQGMHRVPSCFNADHKDISKAMTRIGMCYESEKDLEKGLIINFHEFL